MGWRSRPSSTTGLPHASSSARNGRGGGGATRHRARPRHRHARAECAGPPGEPPPRRAQPRDFRRGPHAHALGGDRGGDADRRARPDRRDGGDRRRLDRRPRQGDRLPHRPAAARDPHDLCRLGDDQPSRRDAGRREEDLPRSESPAEDGHLRCRPDADAAREALSDLGAQRHGPRGRGALAKDGNPVLSLMVEEGLRALGAVLPAIARGPRGGSAKRRALRRLALRHRPRLVLGRGPPQALPRARRQLRSSPRRDPCGDTSPCGRL